jgi:hypothetical protein
MISIGFHGTVAAMGWIGCVTGPPLIGHLAEAVGLTTALVLLPVLILGVAVTIRTAKAFSGPPRIPVSTAAER